MANRIMTDNEVSAMRLALGRFADDMDTSQANLALRASELSRLGRADTWEEVKTLAAGINSARAMRDNARSALDKLANASVVQVTT